MSGFRDYNDLLTVEQASGDDEEVDDEGIREEQEVIEQLERLSHSAEIAAVERRVQELEEEMRRTPEGRDPVTKAFRLPCAAHKVIICLFLSQNQLFII